MSQTPSTEPVLRLLSTDKDALAITITKKAARLSMTLRDLMEDLGDSTDPVPVQVKGSLLGKIVGWMEANRDLEQEEAVDDDQRKLPKLTEEDHVFIDTFDDDGIVELILAANMLDMKHLLDIACISVSAWIKGKTPEDLRKVLERSDKPFPESLSTDLNIPVAAPVNAESNELCVSASGERGTKRNTE